MSVKLGKYSKSEPGWQDVWYNNVYIGQINSSAGIGISDKPIEGRVEVTCENVKPKILAEFLFKKVKEELELEHSYIKSILENIDAIDE